MQSQCDLLEAYQQGDGATHSAAAPETNNARNEEIDKEEDEEGIPGCDNLAVELDEAPDLSMEDFFVASDLHQQSQVACVDPDDGALHLVTHFLALLTIIPDVSSKT